MSEFPNKAEVAAIKTLFLEEQRRFSNIDSMTIEEIMDRGCVYDTNRAQLIFETVLDNLEKLRKRVYNG